MVLSQEANELANMIKSRRSVRLWQEKAVPEEMLSRAIELAAWTANPGNMQNWHFYIVTNKQSINAMADAVEAVSAEINSWPEMAKLRQPPPPGAPPAPPARKPGYFRQAPAVIVAASTLVKSPQDLAFAEREKYDPRATQIREWRSSANPRLQTIAGAIAQLLLVLHQMGLGAVWMTGPMQAKGDIEKILHMPSTMEAAAIVPVGYPAETPVSRGRKPIAEVCEIIR